MLLVEELAARGWPAAETVRADGWLLRHTPSLTRRRSNSALPVGDAHGDPALVEDFYARRGGARARAGLARRGVDEPRRRAGAAVAGRARARPTSSSPTRAVLARTTPGDVALAARPDAGWVAAWAACEERPDADVHAREVLGAHRAGHRLCPRGRRPGRRPGRLRTRLGGAVLRGHGDERTPPRHRAHRGARADGLGRRARRAADLPTGRERQRRRARAVRGAGFERSHGYHYRVAPRAV